MIKAPACRTQSTDHTTAKKNKWYETNLIVFDFMSILFVVVTITIVKEFG